MDQCVVKRQSRDMKLKLDKEDTNYIEILDVPCLMEYNHIRKMWEGWIKDDSSHIFMDKKAEEVYSDMYWHIKCSS